jgi:tetratricopeptide (TPR) repeat protein
MTANNKNSAALLELRNLMKTKLSNRIKNDAYFYFNLSKLISQNRSPTNVINRDIEEAEAYILKNEKNFSRINLNHFYFDLAKCFFNSGNIQKAFTYFNEIYQNLNVKGHTLDFYVHSRLLFCLCCFELREFELMIYSAKATNEFVKRNKLMYEFEKRMLKFIIRKIPKTIGDKKDKLLIFKKLSADLAIVFQSEFERSVLNYFDYEKWINDKIKNLNA